MSRLLLSMFLLLNTWPPLEPHDIKVTRSVVPLPDGDVLGVAFYEDHDTFFVQQSVLSTENHGLVIRFHVQLSSWDLKTRSLIAKRVFAMAPEGMSPYPCGRVVTSAVLQRLLLCSDESALEVIDPSSLNTVGTIAWEDGQHIKDFAVDDLHRRVFALSARRDGSLRIATYALLNGEKQQEVRLPITTSMSASLVVSPQSGRVGIVVNVPPRSRFGETSAHVFACEVDAQLTCTNIAQTVQASQIGFLGQQLLIATGTFARDKKDCILTIEWTTGRVSRGYCSPSRGVHYAVGVVENSYVVGYTGMSKRNVFSEEIKSASSSFSVWRAGNSQVTGVVEDPVDYGAHQNAIGVVGSSSEPVFIAYHRASNVLALYSIADAR